MPLALYPQSSYNFHEGGALSASFFALNQCLMHSSTRRDLLNSEYLFSKEPRERNITPVLQMRKWVLRLFKLQTEKSKTQQWV